MKIGKLNSFLILVFFLILIGLFVVQACSFSNKAATKLYNEATSQGYDAIVVPGVPFEGEKWSSTMKARVLWGIYLYRQGITKNIIFSGGAVHSPYIEAQIMSMYAQKLGVPEENIFLETKAEHSTENIYYSYQLARSLGLEKIALASDPFQTKLLRKFVKKRVNPNIDLLPIVLDSLKAFEQKVETPSINYSEAREDNFIPLKEREGFWKRLKGTRGGNIVK